MATAAPFSDDSLQPSVRGFLHSPASPNGSAIVLTHGAGADCNTSLLVAVSEAFAAQGYLVLRCDLPFRQERRGPPHPGIAGRVAGQIFLGGHSYGGRQATMLCADEPELVSGLLLLSYPLHPVRKPEQLRVQHLPNLRTPGLFVHGTRDPLGSVEEMIKALQLVPAKKELMEVVGAGHDLGFKGKARSCRRFVGG
ncbi:MAG: alpha/beta family hydrolase [Terriglobales bacterium]